MRTLFDHDLPLPEVSILLVDWGCRESAHVLDYLREQSVARSLYEILWIEYYETIQSDIEKRLKESQVKGEHPVVDRWIQLQNPGGTYYHKHLLYNVGILFSRGRIITICDSDAIVRPTFVQAILESFKENNNIVFHIDEVRNSSKRFYPFNYPSIEDVTAKGCLNWADGRPSGMMDSEDPLHSRDYGACFSALREHVVAVGGADEHIAYLGYASGPYEMTWRLVNAGRQEVWHPHEFLFHVWHPGTGGSGDYAGPHDGGHLSTTALATRFTGRVLPLLENPAIRMLRRGLHAGAPTDLLLSGAVGPHVEDWRLDQRPVEESSELVRAGHEAYARKDYAEAIECWEKARNGARREDSILTDLGWCYYYQARYPEACDCFNGALQVNSNDEKALRGAGWTALQDRNLKAAIAHFTAALRVIEPWRPDHLQETFRGRAWAYFHQDRTQEAADDFEKAMEHTSIAEKTILQELYRGLGWCALRTGSPKVAQIYFENAITNLDPNSTSERKDAEDGCKIALRASEGASTDLKERANLDEALAAQGAILPFLAPRDKDGGIMPGNNLRSRLSSDLAWSYYHRSMYREAMRMFEQALSHNHYNAHALSGRGWTHFQRGEFQKSVESFSQCLQLRDGMDKDRLQEALRGRGWAHHALGSYEDAVRDFTHALEFTGHDNRVVLRNILLGRSLAYYKSGLRDRALEDATKLRQETLGSFYSVSLSLALRSQLSFWKQVLKRSFKS